MPYEVQDGRYEWIPLKDGRWEETKLMRGSRKDFRVGFGLEAPVRKRWRKPGKMGAI